MLRFLGFLVVVSVVAAAVTNAAAADDSANAVNETPTEMTMEDLLWEVAEECLGAPRGMRCVRRRLLVFLRALDSAPAPPFDPSSGDGAAARSEEGAAEDPVDAQMDAEIAARALRFARSHALRLHLPQALGGVAVTLRADGGLPIDATLPEDASQGRDMMMKKKMLLPLLLLLKLKMKALTPILLAIVGLKAMKALILSKISFLLVAGFMIVQLCKKLGMMPAAMPMGEMAPAPTPASPYGPPTDSYGAPGGWDSGANGGAGGATAGGPYSRVWTPVDAQRLAYNAYAPATSASQR